MDFKPVLMYSSNVLDGIVQIHAEVLFSFSLEGGKTSAKQGNALHMI